MTEEWRDLEGCKKPHQVSSMGRVKRLIRVDSKNRIYPEKFRFLEKVWTGYLRVNIDGKKIPVHRLVCQAFLPNPLNLPCVNHKDGVKDNNNVENLEWISRSDNIKHAYDTGLLPKMFGTKNPSHRVNRELRKGNSL